MKNVFCFFLIILILSACSNDEGIPPFFELSCLGDATSPINSTTCDNFPLNAQICEAVYVGDYMLEEESRSFIPQFCRELGDVDSYVNGNGDKMEMEIYFKSFIKSHSLKNTFMPCENDSTKNIGACIGLEFVQLQMRSADSIINLSLQLKTKLGSDSPLDGKVADYIEILRFAENNTLVQDFSIIVNERNIGFSQALNQENLGRIELLGITFDEVMSSDITSFSDPKPFKYYYNKVDGLIAFEDSDGVLWRIEE